MGVQMTAILAHAKDGEGVLVACDSAVTVGETGIAAARGPKWWWVGKALVAGAGDVRVLRRIRARLVLRYPAADEDLGEWGDTVLGTAIADANGTDDPTGSAELLVAVRGAAFICDSDGSVWRPVSSHAAIGADPTAALMGLALAGMECPDARERMHLVLSRLQDLTTCVREPFWVEWVPA